jgi:YVTN family beta-propeller protein
MKVRSRDHRLATVLFTDIVGSTQVAAELGDRRWRALLDRHHAIVRKELKRFRGKEQDTAGDGFFAAFDEPSDAIRCACAVADAVRELGIELRAGLNLGEAELIGGKLGGMAVHAAARIMASAGPGEVLVASTVRDMVPGSGFAFEDRGTRGLRDVPGEWRLFAVTGVDGHARETQLEPDEAAGRREGIQPPPLLQRRSGRIAIGATVLAMIAVAIVVPLANRNPAPPPLSPSGAPKPVDHVLQIDPTSGAALHSIPVGNDPSAIAFGEGSVWVTNSGDGTVSRIDPASRRVVTIHVGHKPDAVAVGAGGVWVANDTDGTVSRIDPLTNRVAAAVDLGSPSESTRWRSRQTP